MFGARRSATLAPRYDPLSLPRNCLAKDRDWHLLRFADLSRACSRAQALAMIAARPSSLPPPAVFEIPRDRLLQAAVESFAGRPAQLPSDFGGVHGVAPVMPRPVRDKGDQLLVGPMHRTR